MPIRIRKAVFPVAGLGTRLLPATKSIPKEMITIVDRPLIQYAVDEAREAGIEELIFVTGRASRPWSTISTRPTSWKRRSRGRARASTCWSRPTPVSARSSKRAAAAAAGAGTRGLVRAAHYRRRAVRGAAPRRADGRQAQLPRADGRGLQPSRRQYRCRPRSAGQRNAQIWGDRSGMRRMAG